MDDHVMECVDNFIKENSGHMSLHEIVTQILDILNEGSSQPPTWKSRYMSRST